MKTSVEDLELYELTNSELTDISGGVSIWRYVGMYVRFRVEGMDDTSAMIAAGCIAYAEN